MLVAVGRVFAVRIMRFSSASRRHHAPIRGVIFDAGGVLFSSPIVAMASALEGRSCRIKNAVASMFGAAAYT